MNEGHKIHEKPERETKKAGYPRRGNPIKKNNPENWNILVSGGKEIKRDICSSGERII